MGEDAVALGGATRQGMGGLGRGAEEELVAEGEHFLSDGVEEIGSSLGKEAAEGIEGGRGEIHRLVDLGFGSLMEDGLQIRAKGEIAGDEGLGRGPRFARAEELVSGKGHEGTTRPGAR